MKWIPFFLLAALTLPFSGWLRNPNLRLKAFTLMGLSPYFIDWFHMNIAIVSWQWGGYTKGFEFSVLDFMAVATFMAFSNTRYRFPFKLSMGSYLIATVLSAAAPEYPETALFYSWQVVRIIFLAAAVYKAIRVDPRVAFAVMKGMAIGILIECAIAIFQRLTGVTQTPGTYIHQNELGLVSHFTMFPALALLLGGRRGWLPTATLMAALVVDALTASRGTVVVAGLGLMVVYVLSTFKKWTPQKSWVLLMGAVAAAVFAPLAVSSLEQRFAKQGVTEGTLQEDGERLRYKLAASMMLDDHPMGVGANNFTYAGNRQGYFDAVGELVYSGRAGNVHNVYWLVAAETGYLGVITFLIFLLAPLRLALVSGFRHVGDPKGDLVLGMGVSLLAVYIHSLEEWIFVAYDIQYLFALSVAIVAGLANDLDRRPR